MIGLLLLAWGMLALLWLQQHKLNASDRQIAALEESLEQQRQRIADLETVVALGMDCTSMLTEDLAHAERRAEHMERCVRRVVQSTPKAAAVEFGLGTIYHN